jgi:phosphatidylserine decarboxylase
MPMVSLRTRLEQIRQARSIHGGVVNLCAAALGVKLSRLPIPSRRLRLLVYRTIFGKKYSALDETQFELPLCSYPSFNALFTRGVRPELRPISQAPDQFLCPCDGTIQDVGTLQQDRILTVKGVEYTLNSLLPQMDTNVFHEGRFAVIFLSPSDCHRVFSPQQGHLEEVTHVPGSRLLVHPPYQRKEFPVFSLNERVVFRFSTALGAVALIMVAGWGVGHITLPLDPSFRPRAGGLTRQTYSPALAVEKGQWIGTFELGSTVILITQPASAADCHVKAGQSVHYGQALFSFPADGQEGRCITAS